MPFMEVQITTRIKWITIDSEQGSVSIPFDDLSKDEREAAESEEEIDHEILLKYALGSRLEGVSVEEGYGVHLSAPGYMDQTEWEVYETPEEAGERALDLADETYADDESEALEEFKEAVAAWIKEEGNLPLDYMLPL